MAMKPTVSLKDFEREIGKAYSYPFYCTMLYTPMNGLDGRLHEYVASRWWFLNSLTGSACLTFALEDTRNGPTIDQFRPEDVYDIARTLGASVRDLPCLVFFTEPKNRNDTLVVRLREFLPEPQALTNDDLTDFFRALQAIVDACSRQEAAERLRCLRSGLEREWPQNSRWAETAARLAAAGGWLVASVTTNQTVLDAIVSILKTVVPLLPK